MSEIGDKDTKITNNTNAIYCEIPSELQNCTIDTPSFDFNNEIHLAKVVKCYDGDTVHCCFKHNGAYYKFNIRMHGYDSPELRPRKSIPKDKREQIINSAIKARDRLKELVLNKNIILLCKGLDKYGRILGIIKLNINDEKSVNDLMIEEGLGYKYNGGTKRTV